MNTSPNIDGLRWQHCNGDTAEANQAVVDKVPRLIKAKERECLRAVLDCWSPTDVVESCTLRCR